MKYIQKSKSVSAITKTIFILLICAVRRYECKNVTLTRDLKVKICSKGDLMPMVGLGTLGLAGPKLTEALDYALGAGYRLIDTASIYRNEEQIGKALKELLPKHNLTRKDIFITTKMWYEYPQLKKEDKIEYGQRFNLSPDHVAQAYEQMQDSLRVLDCDYIDLYLIHFPDTDRSVNRVRWLQLVTALKDGMTRNIGVSNYDIDDLQQVLNDDFGFTPAVNQVKFHPRFTQQQVHSLCRNHGIQLQAWSPLGGNNYHNLRNDLTVKEIADKLGKSSSQVLLRWLIQQDIAVIPRASTKEHIEENIALDFEIPDDDMNVLNNFSQHIV